ncbi:hypothetical protein [Pseudomonas sp. WPR_5_2]|uniref:hypothetical protein n=1 Tax=Pseudomonas sp. WPR_5_2 TaxID=1907371 RepID=UPI000EB0358F|nr:hypothetical protein [Pseudomonas sp. WPR_5_2]
MEGVGYTKIFFRIFKVTEQMPHYKMMMADQFVGLDALPALAETEAATVPQQQTEEAVEVFDTHQSIIVTPQLLHGGAADASTAMLPPGSIYPNPLTPNEDPGDIPF